MSMIRNRLVSMLLLLGVAASSLSAVWWWVSADRAEFYTDGLGLRAARDGHAPRDVLWQPPEQILSYDGRPIGAIDAHVSADESMLVLTKRSSRGDTDLFVATRSEDGWSPPRPLDALNSIDHDLAPSLSRDARRLYFASDRPGGLGGLDIWVADVTETGWTEPRLASVNSAANDTDPHQVAEASSGESRLLFTSDRMLLDGQSPPNHDPGDRGSSIFSAVADEPPRLLIRAGAGETLGGAAVSPNADFVYWVASRVNATSPPRLVRSRLPSSDSGYGTHEHGPLVGSPLDESINSIANIASPSITLEGFALCFVAEDENAPLVVRAVTREVFLAKTSSYGDLLGLIPWLLAVLAIVLLLSLLRRGAASMRWQATLGTLGLMARCVLVSLCLHAALVGVLTLVHLSNDEPTPGASSPTQVALRSSAARASISMQVRGIARTPAAPELEPSRLPLRSAKPLDLSQTGAAAPALSSVLTETSVPVSEADTMRIRPGETRPELAAVSRPLARPRLGDSIPTRIPDRTALAPAQTTESTLPHAVGPTSLSDIAVPALPSVANHRTPTVEPDRFSATRTAPPLDSMALEISDSPDASTMELRAHRDLLVPASAIGQVAPFRPAVPTPSPRLTEISDEESGQGGVASVGGSNPPPLRLSNNSLPGHGQGIAEFESIPRAAFERRRTQVSPLDRDIVLSESLPAQAKLPRRDVAVPRFNPDQTSVTLPVFEVRASDLLGVVVDSETGGPIAGASVKLDRAADSDLTATTAADGTFGLSFDRIPDNAAITATMDGYAPGAANVSAQHLDGRDRVVVRLQPQDPFVLAIEDKPEVHHLGDDAFTGRINSQFQRQSEGLSVQFQFTLTNAHARLPASGAEFRIMAKGSQLDNRVSVNNRRIGTFKRSPANGAFREQRFAIPNSVLRLGPNTVTLRSVDSPGTDHDDFEFVNPQIVFIRQSDGPI
ncbi:MAG: carboxypeptidase regulatory-like domain-containing protein [Planctomycetota bacterium]